MRLGRHKGRLRQIDAGHPAPFTGQGFGQDTPSAAHIQHCHSGKTDPILDVGNSDRVNVVEGLEITIPVPPVVFPGRKLGNFGIIDIYVYGSVAHDYKKLKLEKMRYIILKNNLILFTL